MKNSKTDYRIFSADFETTSFEGQNKTEVWAAACVELWTDDCRIFHSINELLNYFLSFKGNILAYFHNLKFDGCFWLSFLKKDLKFQEAFKEGTEEFVEHHSEMKNNTIKYCISSDGQWYFIQIKINNKLIELRDSYKLLPFSVKSIGEGFKTKHKKLEMEYEGYRYAGCTITDEEKEYIKNDVYVVKEALEEMYLTGHSKLTIGSCCLSEFKSIIKGVRVIKYSDLFPDLKEFNIDPNIFGSTNADEYIRNSYRGGWCYVVKGKENKVFKNGVTADVNSLYPSVMHSESLNSYPIGLPTFWQGDFPNRFIKDGKIGVYSNDNNHTYLGETYQYYYFVRIRTRFKLKKNKLPTIQIKHNYRYQSNEYQETSDVWSRTLKKYCKYYQDADGNIHPAKVELTLTRTDYELIQEQYELYDTEILDGCYFKTEIEMFDEYINKYKKIKMENKGAKRTIAKLFLNNLYGKMATADNSSYKTAYIKEDGSLGFTIHVEHNKKIGYIPIGSAITSYARNFTIRAAQANYYGKNKKGFIYADTDSIHCNLRPDELKGIKVHDTEFNCWKLESCWDKALFVRQKTYIEHITKEDMKQVEKPYYSIKCAGLPQKCKNMLNYSLTGTLPEKLTKYDDDEIEFMNKKRTITDFNIGLKVPGKLMPVRINGGVVLLKTTFEMKNFCWTR